MRFLLACLPLGAGAKAGPALWENGKPACRLVLPDPERDPAAARLQRRLFDADGHADAAAKYVDLSRLVLRVYDGGAKPTPDELAPIRSCLDALSRKGLTPRTKDTVSRMEEALNPLRG